MFGTIIFDTECGVCVIKTQNVFYRYVIFLTFPSFVYLIPVMMLFGVTDH